MGSIVSSNKKKPQSALLNPGESLSDRRFTNTGPSTNNHQQTGEELTAPANQPVEEISLDEWLSQNLIHHEAMREKVKERQVGTWIEIRLFISSTFIDTHSERDILVQRVIPSINRKLTSKFIRVIPVDLRWGVLADESKNCEEIQKTCLNQIDKCRDNVLYMPWFLGLRTDRYGWVQDNYLPENGFEQPQLYDWIERFDSYGKKVSITSLEAIQASQSGKIKRESPTVFFYKRNMMDLPNEPKGVKFPEEFRWIFEFEYVEKEMKDPKLKFQYNVNKNASAYEKDRDALNKFLQGHPEIKWSEYDAQFCDAKITLERENARSFGVGYVKNLEDFEKQVEGDLMESILSNYSSIDTTQVDNYALESIQHRNAVKLKAATFVGRTGLVNKAYQHCVTSGYPNTLILHGEPGCGKSGLLAKIAVDCMSQVEKTNDFLFIQAVDSCPGSSLLEGMMRRLQINLRKYRRDRGETKLSIEFTGNASELKQKHHEFLIESANQYPDKLFVIVIDAVNQFQSRLGAWDMWWLPLKDAPKNLKFMISTLNQENGTFQNARNVSPDAECVPVENMSHEDLKEMVRETLARFNKKLTENEDSNVGNQMDILLSKSQSPLYLIAACEALRKFGIFEKVTQYIENLPNTITDLFSFLLDDWSITYGKLFVHDVAGFICVSKDGLLENQINDLLHYKEQREKGDGQFLYDANFPRIYDSISHFLAAGGGGYLRFFHDQLKYAVRRKFMTESFEQETHACMRDFFQDIIIKQCCETPQVEPPAYFDHILEQLVYHQLKAHQNQDTPLESLKISLRNIYFVKNRIVAKQQQSLSDDYSVALATLKDTEDLEALKQWASFVQLYTSYIQELPNFSLNMAVTQSPNSFVTKDTLSLGMEPLVKGEAYPLYWTNIPMEGDSMLVKYCRGGVCVSANAKRDIVAITGDEFTAVYDMISGELIHDFKTIGSAVSISSDGKTLILGGYSGRISRYNISKGTLEDVVKIFEKDLCTSWLTCTGDNLLACWNEINIHVDSNERYIATWITVLDKNSLKIVKKWCTEKPGFDCCYNERLNMIFSAHLGGDIIGWDLQGNQLCSATFDCDVIHCLSIHPTENKIISGSDDYIIREWSVTKSSVELCNQIEDDDDIDIKSPLHRGHKSVCYDDIGERILTIRFRRKELRIFNISGELLKEMKGHAASIEYMSLVPGKNQVLSSANLHETILWQLPVTKESKKNTVPKMVEEIVRCVLYLKGTHF
ncbi:telomerase protein component 1-like [Clytia hemisphaerica]